MKIEGCLKLWRRVWFTNSLIPFLKRWKKEKNRKKKLFILLFCLLFFSLFLCIGFLFFLLCFSFFFFTFSRRFLKRWERCVVNQFFDSFFENVRKRNKRKKKKRKRGGRKRESFFFVYLCLFFVLLFFSFSFFLRLSFLLWKWKKSLLKKKN